MTLSEAQRRRHLIIGLLGVLAGVTLLGAFTSSGGARMGLFALNLVVDAALVGYLLLLAQARGVAAEREMKVRYLRTAAGAGHAARAGRAPRDLRALRPLTRAVASERPANLRRPPRGCSSVGRAQRSQC